MNRPLTLTPSDPLCNRSSPPPDFPPSTQWQSRSLGQRYRDPNCPKLTEMARIAVAEYGTPSNTPSPTVPRLGPHVVPHPFRRDARLFVKHGNLSLVDEAHTQAYLYHHAQPRPSSSSAAPDMPEVYRTFYAGLWGTFRHGARRRFIFSTTAVAAIANTVAWLASCPLPDAGRIRPVGGGCMCHCVYGMGQAPVPFVDAAARSVPSTQAPHRSRLLFTHSVDSFLWDPPDAAHLARRLPAPQRPPGVGFQPLSIVFAFYLHRWSRTDPLVRAVAAALDFPVSEKLCLLGAAVAILMQSGNSPFGIVENGNHTAPSSSYFTDTNTCAAL
ncbi:hypothetical protein C8R45DRAFT_1114047 [Mycena sanguinolenta]|nr:hypothetical protein C8R45DRAFT_1114047 [Mycena sanguinolenta]